MNSKPGTLTAYKRASMCVKCAHPLAGHTSLGNSGGFMRRICRVLGCACGTQK